MTSCVFTAPDKESGEYKQMIYLKKYKLKSPI